MTELEQRIPVIAVLGRKKSGKTFLIEVLINTLRQEGYKVASGKHVAKKGFSVDKKGTDSWRHRKAGAFIVMLASDTETTLLINDKPHSLQDLLIYAAGCDVMVLEGFSNLVSDNPRVGKIICFKGEEEKLEFNSADPIIGNYSYKGDSINREHKLLLEKTLSYIRKERQILNLLAGLPDLNCGKCGYSSCRDFAKDVVEGKGNIEICKAKKKVKLTLRVRGTNVPLQPFVSEIIRKSILGMVSTLKNVSVEGSENIEVELRVN